MTKVKIGNYEIAFTDDDVVDVDDVSFEGDYNYHNKRMFLIHDHGYTVAVVMASHLQEALDIAVDADKMDRFQVHPEDEGDRGMYMTTDFSKTSYGGDEECPEYVDDNGVKYWWDNCPACLGNAGEPFDIESIGCVEFPLPKRSLTALYGETVEAVSSC